MPSLAKLLDNMVLQTHPFVSFVLDKRRNYYTEEHRTFDDAKEALIRLKETIPDIKKIGIIHHREWDNQGPRVRDIHEFIFRPAQEEVFAAQSPVSWYRWNTWENICQNIIAPGCFLIFVCGFLGLIHLIIWLLGW